MRVKKKSGKTQNYSIEKIKVAILKASEEVEQEIDSYLASGGFTGIIFDFDNLKYISSAGLRIIARIKQNYDDLLLDKMSSDVYEIFEMVGFTDMIEIHRK